MSKFTQALGHLLPRGFAWPRHPASVQQRWLAGIAASFEALHAFIASTVQQWWPPKTCTRLAEWEEALGLPDACIGPQDDMDKRRSLVLQRLRGVTLKYPDSSPAATGSIERMLQQFGLIIDVWYEHIFRVSRDGVCDRLGMTGFINVAMGAHCDAMRVDVDGVDHRLVECSPDPAMVMCLLQQVVPARFAINLFVDPEITVGQC